MDFELFEDRKRDHLKHSLDLAHQATGHAGLNQIRLTHEALPDLNFEQVSLTTDFLGIQLATPFFVPGMTAGHSGANEINIRIAKACARRGWIMGVGSQRRELESPYLGDQWIQLRQNAPGLVLVANLGISQVISTPTQKIIQLLESIQANALAVHLNPLQETLQPEGTPRFAGAWKRLSELADALPIPMIIKETGCGMSQSTLSRLSELPLAAVDVSGLGGTHWGRIEGSRAAALDSDESLLLARASKTFADWGISTVNSVQFAAKTLPHSTQIWASGGVRSGLDAAKLLALGAHRAGFAQPALEASIAGEHPLDLWMRGIELELKIALFCTGSENPTQLRKKGPWTQA